jgi:exosortase/archaeosortase family protein
MNLLRRLVLIPAGFVLAMALNVCRMTFLTIIAAKKGVAVVDQYHDTAGLAITLVCTAGLWGIAVLFKGRQRPEDEKQENSTPFSFSKLQVFNTSANLFRLSVALTAWIVLVEVGVESWYRWHEARMPKSASWTVELPRSNPTFEESPLSEQTQQLLRYDEANTGSWSESSGTKWQMFYFRWRPGRTASYLAKYHTPEICLGAAGYTLHINPGLDYLPVHGLLLPFRNYTMETPDGPTYVFYCRWEDRALEERFETSKLIHGHAVVYGERLKFVLEGKRSVGQQTLEIIVRGMGSEKEAEAAVLHQVDKLIKVEMAAQKG